MNITSAMVKQLRDKTGAGMMDCKEALTACAGDFDKSIDHLRKKGMAAATKRSSKAAKEGMVACYVHMGGRIGVLVDYAGGDEQLGRDLAMQIAASKPMCVAKEDVPPEVIDRERAIYTAQAQHSGKPDNVIAKMVEGRIAKYLAEVTLLGQPFVKNPDDSVAKLLQAKHAKVHAFHMFVVGEGIEKRRDDFVAEVMAQAGNA